MNQEGRSLAWLVRWASICLCLTIVPVAAIHAQMDREAQVASLREARQFGIVIDIESVLPANRPGLDNTMWRETLASRIHEVSGRRPVTVTDPTREAHVYVHVNVMSVGASLVPFSVGVSFIQPGRAGKKSMMVATWESGLVGLVSPDQLKVILDSAESLIDEFAVDLAAAWSSN